MKSLIQAAVVIALCALVTSPAIAQRSQGSGGSSGQRSGGRSGGPPRGGPGGGGPGQAVMRALDADHDHEISAEEIANAVVALRQMDANGDGKLTEADERGINGARRPSRTGLRAQPPQRGRAQPPNVSGQSLNELGERGSRRGQPGRPDGFDAPPSPDQFVKDAMEFDVDENGQLDAVELKTFAQQMGPPRGPRPERGGR